MSVANSTWLRLYTEITRDRKLRRLPPAYRWVWIAIMCIAKESPKPGRLLLSCNLPATAEDIADEAAVDLETVLQALEIFKKLEWNMIHEEEGILVLTNWEKRNSFKSDSSTERVRRHRIKNETLQKRCEGVTVTPPDTDTELYKETDNNPPIIPPNGGAGKPRKPFKSLLQERLFDQFWSVYPKQKSKGQAERTWVKLNPSEQLVALMLPAIKRAKTSKEWTKDGGQFIPHPSTWLNAKGWEDAHGTQKKKDYGWEFYTLPENFNPEDPGDFDF
jgi:hypothetical protein